MNVYLVGLEIIGYKTITLEEAINKANSTIVLFTFKESGKVGDYYDKVKSLLVSSNRLILMTVGESCELSRALSSLMCSYRKYDIYQPENKDIIDENYIQIAIERNPDYVEASTFIGGDVTAYSEISDILVGIDNLVYDKNIDGLKDFIEKHINSIGSLTEVIDSMKQSVEENNSNTLANTIVNLREELEEYKKKAESFELSIGKVEEEKKNLQDSLEVCRQQLRKEQEALEEMQNNQANGGPIIKEYKDINTSLIKCKTQKVIYFKEVSKIPYINSMVLALMARIKLVCKVKLLIYDNNSSIPMYSPLTAIDSKEYINKRELYSGKKEVLLISEPNSAILKDILEYSTEPNTVVIIYDRMKKKENLVSGNNIYKFFVLGSQSEYRKVSNSLSITDKSTVISVSNFVGPTVLGIPYIQGYDKCTESGKSSKYFKALSPTNNQPLIESILKQIRFDSISSN